MSEQQQFGPWTVESNIKYNRALIVTHPNREGEYVLKVARETSDEANQIRSNRQLKNEIKALERVTDHPNIITLVDYDLEASRPWHVTEKIEAKEFTRHMLKSWDYDRLQPERIDSKIKKLTQAIGYLHSKGILLNGPPELFITAEDNFIILDFEECTFWPNHHVDTTDDLRVVADLINTIKNETSEARIQAVKRRDEQRMLEEAQERAQPSAPSRLAEN